MKTPLVSIIIPAYNAEKTIIDCLRSVVNQTYINLEIIVVNDGSTDSTENLILAFKKNINTPFEYYNISNSGPSKARNIGIGVSRGKYIAFIDSDDAWSKDKIRKQVEIMESDTSIGISSLSSTESHIKVKEVTFDKMLYRNYLRTSAVMILKSKMGKLLFDEKQKYSEDYKLWLQIIYKHKGVVIMNSSDVYCLVDSSNYYTRNSLSSNLLEMTKGNFINLHFLYEHRMITFFVYIKLCALNVVKLVRRVLIKYLTK